MKKVIVLLTALLVVCGLLSACAPTSGPDGTQDARGSAPAASVPSPGEPSPAKTKPTAPSPDTLPAMQGMGNSSLNLLNEGYAVLSDGVLYYTDRQNGGNIWRANPDGSGAQMLAEGSFRHLNVSGDRIFCADYDGIHAMRTDGTQARLITEVKFSDKSLAVLDEWLYYAGGTDIINVYRMRSDGSQNTLVAEGIRKAFQIDGNWIYYLRLVDGEVYSHLWKSALDGGQSARVSDIKINQFFIYGEQIYFTDWEERSYGLEKMALDGTGRQEIYDGHVMLCTAAEDWVYVITRVNMAPINDVCRMKIDGSGLEKLIDGGGFQMSVAGDWIFFSTNDEQFRLSKMRLDGSERGFVNE